MIVSHKNCTDGLLAAAIARAYWIIAARKNPKYENYKDVIFLNPASKDGVMDPDGEILKRFQGIEERESGDLEVIYFLDLWPTKLRKEDGSAVEVQDWFIEDKSGPCVVLDHHESSRPYFESRYIYVNGEDNKDNIDKEIEMDGLSEADDSYFSGLYWFSNRMSGAGLSWRYFFGTLAPPTFVLAAQAADLFKWDSVKDSREIFAGIDSYGFNLDFWTNIIIDYVDNALPVDHMVKSLKYKGKILLDNKQKDVANIVDRCCRKVHLHIGDAMWHIVCCNSSFDQTSIGEEMNKRYPDLPALIYYTDKSGSVKGSMRSAHGSDIDVRKICELVGGGGHKNASGFRRSAKDFVIEENIITIKVSE